MKMRKILFLAGMALLVVVVALPLVAAVTVQSPEGETVEQTATQGDDGDNQSGGETEGASEMWLIITSGFAMAIASAGCGIAQAKATAAAAEGMARNPGAAAPIRFALLIGLILIESLALYTFVILLIVKFV